MIEGYELLLASFVGERDGMAMELRIANRGEQIAEVFEDEETKQRTVTFFVQRPVPLEAVEWLLKRAREGL